VEKTTVYLPTGLKRSLRHVATSTGRSEAEVIREAIANYVKASDQPRPRGGLFASGSASLAEHADEALAGFGQR
jgi:hypothetical protein